MFGHKCVWDGKVQWSQTVKGGQFQAAERSQAGLHSELSWKSFSLSFSSLLSELWHKHLNKGGKCGPGDCILCTENANFSLGKKCWRYPDFSVYCILIHHICNCSSREFNLFWPPQAPCTNEAHIRTHRQNIHIHKKTSLIFNKWHKNCSCSLCLTAHC